MYEFIKANQMDIMLALCAICFMMGLMLLITRFLPRRRKWVLIGMELVATFLLFFDRLAYIYSGDTSSTGYIMVRLSNFFVFFLTAGIVFNFDIYLIDLINENEKSESYPIRLRIVAIAALIEMVLVIISQFNGMYYSFDSKNVYHRGKWFVLCYVIPILGPIIQYTVIVQYRKKFSKFINAALFLYIFVPIVAAIIQIFAYGISIVNMAMVLVSVSLYIFTYLDINDEVVRAHNLEMENLQNERKSMKRLFDQTATAFVTAVEKKDELSQGNAARIAEIAKRIAQLSGKNEEECDEVYYTALLHNVGTIVLPDSLIGKTQELTDQEYELIKQKPIFSSEILSCITEYPYLSLGARYSCEKYDGSGYPEGTSGKDIPEIARIISVANAYVAMMSQKRFRNPVPMPVIREEFVKGAGIQYDPIFADAMVRLMDSDVNANIITEEVQVEKELKCGRYRDKISKGIEISEAVTNISFLCAKSDSESGEFSQPSIILFDSFDRQVYSTEKMIDAFKYTEYGELWFDGHSISTNVRNMEVSVSDKAEVNASELDSQYRISACRYEDHLKLTLESDACKVLVIVALPDKTKSAYIGITGENCYITGINIEKTDIITQAEDIPRIASAIDYTDRLVSDIPNLQIDRSRSAATDGIAITDHLRLSFHSLSLPSATFVWNCPYVVLFYSDDKKVFGEGYREYAMVKLNGESDGIKEFAENKYVIEKKESFQGWDSWKATSKLGMECDVKLKRKGNKITMNAETLGISIENLTTINDGNDTVYVALTGDQVALTDIRIR